MICNISRLSHFMECRQKSWYWDHERLMPPREAEPLVKGGSVHEGIAEFLAHRDARQAVETAEVKYRERLASQVILPEERAELELSIKQSRAMVDQFCRNYSDTEMQVIWPEVSFCVPLPGSEHHCRQFHEVLTPNIPFERCMAHYSTIGPDALLTRRCIQPIYFAGKTDAVVSWKHQIWLLEHKTTSMTGSIFYDKFFLDFQPTGYLYGIGKAMGTRPHGFIINALKKPPKNARDQLACSFERDFFLRSDEDLDRFEREFIMQVQDYEDAFNNSRIYMNTKSCLAWNRRCYYWNVCKRHGQPSPDEFKIRDIDYVEAKYYEILGLPLPEVKPQLVTVEEV